MSSQWTRSRTVPLKYSLMVVAAILAAPVFGTDAMAAGAAETAKSTSPAPPATESQREAAAILKSMAEYMAGLQSFTCTLRAGYDAVQSTGQKIEFGETRQITMARPNRLRVEEVASDGVRDLALFDGRNMTVMNADTKVYAQAPQPGSVDDALIYFVRDLKMRMPLALLLTTRLPGELTQRVKSVDYVESDDIYGVPTDHIAGRGENVDFQFWITEGAHPLPLRVVITYLHSPGQPQYWANFSDWNTSPKLANTAFDFKPPQGARKVAFAVQVPRPNDKRPPTAATGEIQP